MIPLYFVYISFFSGSTGIPYLIYFYYRRKKRIDKVKNFVRQSIISQNVSVTHSRSLEKLDQLVEICPCESYMAFKFIRSIMLVKSDNKCKNPKCCKNISSNKVLYKIYDANFCSEACQSLAYEAIKNYI